MRNRENKRGGEKERERWRWGDGEMERWRRRGKGVRDSR